MNWTKVVKILLLSIAFAVGLNGQTRDYTRYVNPFIGTGGHGHTFPGATMPFGMVQLSPDTRTDNWDGSSGYHYSDDIIYGFSHTHLSGTGIPDYCDILLMPTIGEPQFFAKEGDKSVNGYASKFSHANEKAEPGYYSVKLDDDGILAEMTATARVGMHRYTFPKSDKGNILLDLKWRDKVLDAQFKVSGQNRIEGYRRSSSWAKDQIIYFVAEFSKPFQIKSIENSKGKVFKDQELFQYLEETSKSWKAALKFKTVAGEQILVKVALSPVSIEGARKNLEAELPGWDFDKVRADAKAAWNKELSKIEVSGGTDAQTTTFYTALYHTMIQPNVFNDIDGNYRGHDGKVHNISEDIYRGDAETQSQRNPKSKITNPKSDEYTVFSLWDTFRAAHPLYTIIDQKRTADFINTFIRQYEQGGRLPVWELAGNETDCMIGYHAVSVIADAMAKGIKGFDYEKAYEAAKHSAELDHFGLAAYKKRGYISMEDENESVSKTLEYAYDDWCIVKMALLLSAKRMSKLKAEGKTSDGDKQIEQIAADWANFMARPRFFENVFDPGTGFFRPKQNGSFVKPFAPNEVTFNFTEGNSWVYSFFVPHDISRLIELQGGKEEFAAKLDELFTTTDKLTGRDQPDITGLIGQYAHGNEPSHHITYLYDYAGQPWKTQKYVRQIMDEFYKPTPDGLIGNEDCGQMSAWYVLSASGFYPVTPGDPTYAFGTPLFPQIIYHLENGKSLVIRAKNVSPKNIYIKAVRINGMPYTDAFITQSIIERGDVFEFEMTDTPVPTAFTKMPSIKFPLTGPPAVPIIESEGRVFKNKATIAIKTITPETKIYYTINGGNPSGASMLYTKPFTIDTTSSIKAISSIDQSERTGETVSSAVFSPASPVVEARFYKKPNDWTVKIGSPYSTQYTGGGDNAVVDGIRGTVNFVSGEWQGYQGKTFEAVIDLQREMEITNVGGSFLQAVKSWIWMPDHLEFEASTNGTNFVKIADLKPGFPQQEMNTVIKEFRQSITPTKARYVRVRAFNFGKIPSWHPGAGGDPWIFVDEIFID
jgi:putative alpha-1,2-mannosidase